MKGAAQPFHVAKQGRALGEHGPVRHSFEQVAFDPVSLGVRDGLKVVRGLFTQAPFGAHNGQAASNDQRHQPDQNEDHRQFGVQPLEPLDHGASHPPPQPF